MLTIFKPSLAKLALPVTGQKDPLIEYKTEGYELFLDMMTDIRRNVVYSLFQFQPQPAMQVSPEMV